MKDDEILKSMLRYEAFDILRNSGFCKMPLDHAGPGASGLSLNLLM